MRKRILFFLVLISISSILSAQKVDIEALKTKIAEKSAIAKAKQGEVDAINAEIAAMQKQIDLAVGWRFNTSGVLGFSLSGFQNWAKQANPNSKVSNITGVFKGTALLEKPKYFWRNESNINLGWQKFELDANEATEEQKKYQNIADIFSILSLFGYKITPDIAASGLSQYNSSIAKNFNNPGIFDIGAGATWTPHQIPNFVLTVHPVNYHIVFQSGDKETKSALGTKIFASYFTTLFKGVKWSTDLTGFFEYGKSDPSLNEYTWNNTISLPAFHGIGIGIGFGLRDSVLESDKLQSYYNVGLSYNL